MTAVYLCEGCRRISFTTRSRRPYLHERSNLEKGVQKLRGFPMLLAHKKRIPMSKLKEIPVYHYTSGRYELYHFKEKEGVCFKKDDDLISEFQACGWALLKTEGEIEVYEKWEEFKYLFILPSSFPVWIYINNPSDLFSFLKEIGTNYRDFSSLKYSRIIPTHELEFNDELESVTSINDETVYVTSFSPILTWVERREANRRRRNAFEKNKMKEQSASPLEEKNDTTS